MLYRQWRQLDWPIFVDSLNTLNVSVVPIPIAIDESGVVQHASIMPDKFVADFLNQNYPRINISKDYNIANQPALAQLRSLSQQQGTASAWRNLGDAIFLSDSKDKDTQTINAYRRAITLNPMDGRAFFRSGVALRRRFESPQHQPGDGQNAVIRWVRALAINPNQYIWRRRIQQYGPRLDKPYNFYYWVEQARTEIVKRGDTPIELPIEPTGSELAGPLKANKKDNKSALRINVDRSGQIARDNLHLVDMEAILTPAMARPGSHLRVQINFRLADKKAVWNNEAEDLYVWFTLPNGVSVSEAQWTYSNPQMPESSEQRTVDIELALSSKMKEAVFMMPGYALYYVCEKTGDQCQYLRQDITVPLNISSSAVKLR